MCQAGDQCRPERVSPLSRCDYPDNSYHRTHNVPPFEIVTVFERWRKRTHESRGRKRGAIDAAGGSLLDCFAENRVFTG